LAVGGVQTIFGDSETTFAGATIFIDARLSLRAWLSLGFSLSFRLHLGFTFALRFWLSLALRLWFSFTLWLRRGVPVREDESVTTITVGHLQCLGLDLHPVCLIFLDERSQNFDVPCEV